ncbi:aspartyl protease family protein [Brevundimonas balnearis]|uniref:Aspartyl protease family protein n=1 Tax=Brevundimonas balnearis TaxID=1572858 RepID=A0ABV6R3X3_9CAUL
MGTRRSFLIRAGLVAAGLGGAWWLREHVIWPAPDVRFMAYADPPWLRFADDRARAPIVAASLAGRSVMALVDSGAQYSVIDRALVAELNLGDTFSIPFLAYGVGGGSQVGRGVSVDVAVGGVALQGLRTAILDLGPLAAAEGLSTPLILGQDVLQRADLWLDLPGRRLAFASPGAPPPWADLRPAVVRRRGDALVSDVSIEGAVTTALVDTGSTSLLALSAAAASEVGLLDGREAREGSSLVLGGMIRSQVVTARTVTFADALFRDVEVAIYPEVAGGAYPNGLIGMGAFRGRRAVLRLGAGELLVSRAMDVDLG